MAENETSIDKKAKSVDNTSPMGGGTFILYQCQIVTPANANNPIDFNSENVFRELNIYECGLSKTCRYVCFL